MDENLSRGYVQLGKARRLNEMKLGENGFARMSPPVDKWNLIYLSLMLAGAGFLLPYNSFVIAVDYFQARYPGTTVIFDMSVVYITMAFFAVLVNNILVETLSLGARITFGYLVSFLTLNFVVICEVWWEVFGVATSYTINLVAVAIVSLGCTVQQSSFYGYTSMLPSRYTQAVMAGESAAGFWVSINRVITKSLVNDERGNTSMFFALSILTIVLCFVMQQIIYKTEFVQYYITMCQEKNKITLEPQEDAGLMDPLDQENESSRGQYGVLKLQTSPMGTDSAGGSIDMTNTTGQFFEFSFSNPVYDPNAPSGNSAGSAGPTYKVEDIVVMRGRYGNTQARRSKRWSGIRRGLTARLDVAKVIYPYMASIGIAYFVTLCLYPGIISEIVSCKFGSWMPVILMSSFNGADVIGKILATLPCQWTRTQLLNFACARTLLIPLFLMCAIPRRLPVLSNELYAILLSVFLGVTNGIVGSVPMVQAPTKVPEEHRELAGNIMTLSYTTGLTLGSILAYMLDACLGPALTTKQLCPQPVPALGPGLIINVTMDLMSTAANTWPAKTSTTMATTVAATVLATVERATKKAGGAIKRATKMPRIRTTTMATTTTTTTTTTTNIVATLLSTILLSATTPEGFAGTDLATNTTASVFSQLMTNATTIAGNTVYQH
ncbi:PREDICTED: equilibrative nucleoside transporter 4 [Ceratosolen solmsi marchali]|uniref:Equilibrative nucleoside transporter 4 n=1 Tax=Ceratosolen solmsi marchali TaxID=326594 RepID=A0AAJ7DWI8_9HYME|nr:PREDICTED: equilibrative nucleoside transporter 4 [Ceratosolen solmsi marchali]